VTVLQSPLVIVPILDGGEKVQAVIGQIRESGSRVQPIAKGYEWHVFEPPAGEVIL
jgi:hypothetical protein